MENFAKLLKTNNKDEIRNFMKNSKIDLLKSIAKRFKLSISAKNKSQIIDIIMDAVESGKEFREEPSLAQMSVAQLKNKAIELNIDISTLKVKQDLRMAILKKMAPAPSPSSTTTTTPTTLGSTMAHYDSLKEKSLVYLKALAKQLKIKISKLSKEQLITSILEKTSSLGELPSLTSVSEIKSEKDLSKLTKNMLMTKAVELGYQKNPNSKSISKQDLVDFILSNMSGIQKTATTKNSDTIPSIKFPITPSELSNLKKTLKVSEIKNILKKNNIKIPSGVTKKEDLMPLLLKIQSGTKATTPSVDVSSVSTELPESEPTDVDIDIVPLEDIESPFVPADVSDLTVAPTEESLSADVIRCLKFYEYPS